MQEIRMKVGFKTDHKWRLLPFALSSDSNFYYLGKGTLFRHLDTTPIAQVYITFTQAGGKSFTEPTARLDTFPPEPQWHNPWNLHLCNLMVGATPER